ncbi:MAG: hypothetical protein SNJ60_02510 [Pseudanabaenaceae cyanobacterium]
MNEFTPLWQSLTRQPLAFVGGLVAGALRLDLQHEPLKSWLQQYNVNTAPIESRPAGPQSITID